MDEIELSWKLIDTIKKANLPIYSYAKNSNGPIEQDNLHNFNVIVK